MKRIGYQQLEKKVREYFAQRKTPRIGADGEVLRDKTGAVLYEEKAATVTGLAFYLGFSSREEMLSIQEKKTKALFDRALLKIEEQAEEKLFCKDCFQGAKLFLAANFKRWREESKEEVNVDLGVFSAWTE